MQRITLEEIEAAKVRLVKVRQDIADQKTLIAKAKNQAIQTVAEGLSIVGFFEQVAMGTQKLGFLQQAEKLIKAEIEQLEREKLAYDAALEMAKDELQLLEEAQVQNNVDYFRCLAGAWEAAFTAAVVSSKAKELEKEFKNDLLCRHTMYGVNYLNDVESLIALLEARQPKVFQQSGIPTYSERHKRANEARISLIL